MSLSLIENIQFNDNIFFEISTIYICFLTLAITAVILIISLSEKMKISFMLDSEKDYLSRSPRFIDLVYSHIWRGRLVFHDRNDPTGRNLALLFSGKLYSTVHFNGIVCYAFSPVINGTVYRPDGSIDERLPVLPGGIASVEGNRTLILSGLTPVSRNTTFLPGTITFMVKNHQL